MQKFIIIFVFFSSVALASEPMVHGKNFSILQTQQIEFVELNRSVPIGFKEIGIPDFLDLRNIQSQVKHQGQRGSCAYFTASSLVESLIKKEHNIEIDISEEFIAWSSKAVLNMRVFDEDSSVAVNLFTVQEMGFLLESDFPYQESWFNEGQPCAHLSKDTNIRRCFSHDAPTREQMSRIIPGSGFVFTAVDSRSLDVIRALAINQAPVTASIKGHPETWSRSVEDGVFRLTPQMKKECLDKTVACSGHAVLIVGYDLKSRQFLFKNSWGEEWGRSGYGWIDFDYMDQQSARKFMTGELTKSLRSDLN